MDTEEAWQQFQKSPTIQKSVDDNNTQNLRGMLDTILAQQQEILTNTKRTAEIVPKILGDESAIDAANDEAAMQQQMMAQMGGMPPGGMPPGAPPEEGAPEGAPPEEGQGGDGMTEEDIRQILMGNGGDEMPPAEGEGVPPEAMGAEGGMPPGGELPPEAMGAEGGDNSMDQVKEIFKQKATEAMNAGQIDDAISILGALKKIEGIGMGETGPVAASGADEVPVTEEHIEKSEADVKETQASDEHVEKSCDKSIEKADAEASESADGASNSDIADNPVAKARDAELDEKKYREASDGASKVQDKKEHEAHSQRRRANHFKDGDRFDKKMARKYRIKQHKAEKVSDVANDVCRRATDSWYEARFNDEPVARENPKYGPNFGRGYPPEDIGSGKAKKSAMPSFRDMVAYHEANPLAGVYDRGISIRKSMFDETPAISNETEQIAKADVDAESMPTEDIPVDDAIEEPVADPVEEQVGEEVAAEDEAISEEEIMEMVELIAEYCNENGITEEELAAMSDDELAELITIALGGGEEAVPEEEIDAEGEEPIPEDVPEAEPVAEDTAEIGKSASESVDKSANHNMNVAYGIRDYVRNNKDKADTPEKQKKLGELHDKGENIVQNNYWEDRDGRAAEKKRQLEQWGVKSVTEKKSAAPIEKSDDEIQEAGCPCDGLTGPDRIEKDSVASASEVHPHTSVNDTGTSHSVEGVMPSSGTHDPDAIASAEPTTGPLKTGLNVMKSEGKHIVSMRELMERNMKKSQSARPDSVCSTNGDLSRPEVSTVAKSAGSATAGTQSKDLNGFIESARNGMQRYREATAQRENII